MKNVYNWNYNKDDYKNIIEIQKLEVIYGTVIIVVDKIEEM